MEALAVLPLPEQIRAAVLIWMVIFARVGTAIIMLPGLGDAAIPPRAKIAFSVLVSLVVSPIVALPPLPAHETQLMLMLASEATIGVFIGVGARVLLTALHVLGAQIGFTAGLSNALAPNDGNYESASTIGALMTLAAVALLFAVDGHHIMLRGLIGSYSIFPGGSLMAADLAEQMVRVGAASLYTAVMIGAPFFAISLLVNLGLGIANRVMPAMQVFFVATPGLIFIALLTLFFALPSALVRMVEILTGWFATFAW